MKVQAHFEAKLSETQRTQVRYGFRNEQWLQKHHGDRKAGMIMKRKKHLRLMLGHFKIPPHQIPKPRHVPSTMTIDSTLLTQKCWFSSF